MKKLALILVAVLTLLAISSSCMAKIITYREVPCIERTNAQGSKYWKVLRWTQSDNGQFRYFEDTREVPVDSLTFMTPDEVYQKNHGFVDPIPKIKSFFGYLFSMRFIWDLWALAKFVLVLIVVIWLLRKLFARRKQRTTSSTS
ncbi:hypothetical protein HOB10_04220 [Candidatus Parcubacteria bacterium]|jgi:hypothetical protein|nr:hypothetical protein [Candidatus Parcubacteria bacterium]